MNFEFSDDMRMLADQAERLCSERQALSGARAVHEGKQAFDKALWAEMLELGFAGAGIPEEYGGSGFGAIAPCMIAEQLGQSLAALPYASSIAQAAEAILHAGSEQQKRQLLPALVQGRRIGAFWAAPLFRRSGRLPLVRAGRIDAERLLVADAMLADLLVLAASDEAGAAGLYLVELGGDGVERASCTTVDPSRNHGRVSLVAAPATPLGDGAMAAPDLDRLLASLLILIAFEQLGVASASLRMARDYALTRHAFGRPIGSFQAIKHKLAHMFIRVELARSNAAYGAWARATSPADLVGIAATARLSALRACHMATREALQTFGGMGMTWEADIHLYLKRARLLAASYGGDVVWSERILAELEPARGA